MPALSTYALRTGDDGSACIPADAMVGILRTLAELCRDPNQVMTRGVVACVLETEADAIVCQVIEHEHGMAQQRRCRAWRLERWRPVRCSWRGGHEEEWHCSERSGVMWSM